MSNSTEDRIERWRARRAVEEAARGAHAGLPTPLALLASDSEQLALSPPEDAGALLSAVLTGLRGNPSDTPADRRAVYDAVSRGLERGGEQAALDAETAELRRRQLRLVIRLVEGDLREGVDITAPDYRPKGLEEAVRPLVNSHERLVRRRVELESRAARRNAVLADEAYSVAVEPEDEADLAVLRAELDRLDAVRGGRPVRGGGLSLKAVSALFRYQLSVLMAESRLALAWTLIGPAVLLAVISSLYLVVGTHHILNMDVQTFALLGATTWIMFRQIIFRTSTAFFAQRALLNLQPLTPTLIGLSQGLIYFMSYIAVYTILIAGGWVTGFFTLPAQVAGPAFWIAMMGLSGMAMGIIFGSIAAIWPYFLRFAPIIERALQLFSSVFFVSEQLPDQYRPYLLWSPFAHALQLLRQAYFEGYESPDADPEYFFVWLGVLILVAALLQRAVRWRSRPM